MRVFYKKMGIEQVRFKPAYNPYTEVSYLMLCKYRNINNNDTHAAFIGNLRIPSHAQKMGRSW